MSNRKAPTSRPGATGAPPTFWKRKDLLIALGIVLAITAVAFAPALTNGFVNWDDDINVYKNENIAALDGAHLKAIFTSRVIGGYTPLTTLSFAVERHFFGLNPRVFHLTNLVLHLVCVFFVYRILLELKLSLAAAFFGALLFGIHPMRVESVAWITERKDVLFGSFYLGALFCYLRYLTKPRRATYLATAVLALLGLLSKIQAVALPLSMVLVDYYLRRPLDARNLVIKKLPFWLFSLGFGLMGLYFLDEHGSLNPTTAQFSALDKLFIGTYAYVVYLIKLLVPYQLSPLYPYPPGLSWHHYASIVPALGVLGLAWIAWKKGWRPWVFGLGFFTLNVMFLLQILGAGQGFLADRYTYIPYFGLFFLVAAGCEWFCRTRPSLKSSAVFGLGIYLLVCAIVTWKQTTIWKNGETLWTHVLKHYDKTSVPWNNRGQYRREQRQYAAALQDFSQALRLEPNNSAIYNSRGKTYFDAGDPQKAIADYTQAAELKPDDPEIYVNRGAAYGFLKRHELALRDLNRGIELNPEFKNAYLNRFLVHNETGQHEKALQDCDAYLRLDPGHASLWFERGMCQRRLGKKQEALADFNRAIGLNPAHGLFYYERAKLLLELGNKAQAAQDIHAAERHGVRPTPEILGQLR